MRIILSHTTVAKESKAKAKAKVVGDASKWLHYGLLNVHVEKLKMKQITAHPLIISPIVWTCLNWLVESKAYRRINLNVLVCLP